MANPEFAQISLTATAGGHLLAWVDGKLIGLIITSADDDTVCIKVMPRAMRSLRGRPAVSNPGDELVHAFHREGG